MIDIQNLSVDFSGGHHIQAVEQVSLTLHPHEKSAIIGETGSGKSVLLLAILGLLPPSAQVSGSIYLNQTPLLGLKKRSLNNIRGQHIAYVPQGSGHALNPLMTIGFQVGEPLLPHRRSPKKDALKRAIGQLSAYGIEAAPRRARFYPHMFSGGMKQRAMLAMGTIAEAPYILADEPTKGLDIQKVKYIAQQFKSLEQQAILCVTHDLDFAKWMADTLHVMYAGQQIESGDCHDLLDAPMHPYTQDLLRALPQNGLICGSPLTGDTATTADGCRYAPRCRQSQAICQSPPPLICRGQRKVRCWLYANESH